MLGVALEGGGARGAFHVGAIRALLEEGYQIDGIVGTSIGAFNAAMVAQGDFEKCFEMWSNVTPQQLFDIEDRYMANVINRNLNIKTITYFSSEAKRIITNRGIDTDNLRKVVDELIDEEKLRNSNMDFGLVTVELGPLSPIEVFKEDIPNGKIKDFIMASARYPGLKMEPLDGKAYLDGGLYDNCPVNLLSKKNYDKIIAIRLNSSRKLKHIDEGANVVEIQPSMDLGGTFIFTKDLAHRNIKLGYYDAIKAIRKLKGREYYIEPIDNDLIFSKLLELPDELIIDIGISMGLKDIPPKRMLFEFILPNLSKYLNLKKEDNYQDIIIALLENMAKEREVEKFKIYSLPDFFNIIKDNEKESSFHKKVQISLRGLKRKAIENITQVDMNIINEKLLCMLEDEE
ncbi:patatin-like phospholipase family protein [Terrisporobacter petrolearius]|uniref:patatin-like phospholipase family protein n=1 Tax=Terrisporobacter petrolearius TaxID=1460447 RepID=UPI001D165578|nr:patatin-like phospholipase family protein [Terrisporobacter petrolearius]MCC3865389.1 patatin-like phospholipase family protein [Terrisporobacter petrolearius]